MGLRNYTLTDEQFAIASPPKTIWNLVGGTTIQIEAYEVDLSSRDTPANVTQSYVLGRTTAAGTSAATPPTAAPVNPASTPASLITVGWHHSAEPTYTTSGTPTQVQGMLFSVNKQNTWRWVVQPGYGLGAHSSLTASNGVGLKCTGASTAFPVDSSIAWAE